MLCSSLTALGSDLGTKGVLAKPHRKITVFFCMLPCLFFGLRDHKDSGHSLCPSENHQALVASVPTWLPLLLCVPAMEELWKPLLQPHTALALAWGREESRDGEDLTPFIVKGWRRERCAHTPPCHTSKGCLGDTWARQSPGLCHCSSKCHLQVLEVLMAFKCIFQIFSELITPLPLQRGSVPTQAHITHMGQQSGHPRVAQAPEGAELCSPAQEQERT